MAGTDWSSLILLFFFLLGATIFPLLTAAYWWELRKRPRSEGEWSILAFSAVSAAAFLLNRWLEWGVGEWPLRSHAAVLAGWLNAGMPALMVGLAGGSLWLAAAIALAGWWAFAVGGLAEPLVYLVGAGVGGVVGWKLQGWHRRWVLLCCGGVAAGAAGALWQPESWWSVIPDLALLLLFGVTLYYRERLMFLDVVIKQGALLALFLPAVVYLARTSGSAFYWIIPMILLAPPLGRRLGRWIDRIWLGRVHTPVEAERLFAEEIQRADTEVSLQASAEHMLARIFQVDAWVRTDETGNSVLCLSPRSGGVPWLSDDFQLLRSLEKTYRLALDNLRYRIEQRRQQERERELLLSASRAELKALRAQIDPHFLFNALNTIAGLIRERPDLADDTIERLARVFRYTLRRSGQEMVALGEEIDFAEAYLRIEQARLGDRLSVDFRIGPSASEAQVPAMCVQPLLENAIHHGVMGREGPARVAVSARLESAALVVEVRDDGPGFPPAFCISPEAGGHGLHNVAERLAGYYDGEGHLDWERVDGETVVRIRIPILSEKTHAAVDRR